MRVHVNRIGSLGTVEEHPLTVFFDDEVRHFAGFVGKFVDFVVADLCDVVTAPGVFPDAQEFQSDVVRSVCLDDVVLVQERLHVIVHGTFPHPGVIRDLGRASPIQFDECFEYLETRFCGGNGWRLLFVHGLFLLFSIIHSVG